MNAAPTTTAQVIGRIVRVYMLPRWPAFLFGIGCAVVTAFLTAGLALSLQPIVNGVLVTKTNTDSLFDLVWIVAGISVLRGAAAIGQAFVSNRVGLDIVNSAQTELMGKLMHADLARLRSNHSGAFLSQIINDCQMIQTAATTGFLSYVQSGLTVAALLGLMFVKDSLLTVIVLVFGPIVAWVLRVFSRFAANRTTSSMDANAALATAVLEGLDGVRVVKVEGREGFEQERLQRVLIERKKMFLVLMDAQSAAAPISEIMTFLMVAVVIAYFVWRAHTTVVQLGPLELEHMTPGAFAAFLAALLAAGQSLRQFSSLQTTLAYGLAGARRLFSNMDIVPEIHDGPSAKPIARATGALRFEDVTFAYGDEAPVLNGVSIEARRGEIVALVGPSGGGKTTMLSLAPRFYEAGQGRILLDDRDIRDITLASLRAQIGLVTQEPFLFDDTIAANITYSKPGAGREEIETAARHAAAHDFISEFPNGYETRVGELGIRLSGGQRQRIAIARAFLKNAPLLLLDEATSALDTESEAQVQAALERLMEGRTTILIAHRLSTVRGADRIYVIDRGRVVESGDHTSLMRDGGLYARLAGSQDLDLTPEPA
jgi:ATP-binding cassette, subfamily B, bacterial MsbA